MLVRTFGLCVVLWSSDTTY